MAVYYDAYVSLDSNNLSNKVQSLELPMGVETLDDTAMGDTTRSNAAGLKTWTATINFHQTFVDNDLDEIIYGLYNAGAAFACEFRPTSASVGAGNPKYTGNGIITEYTPLSGSVGDQHVASVTIVAAGTLSRAVS
jgi:hypothetical protein